MSNRPHQNLELIRRVLGDDYLELKLKRLTFEESFDEEKSKIRVETTDSEGGNSIVVEGEGVGLIDALMHGLHGRFADEYQSLKSTVLTRFSVNAQIDTKEQSSGSDAVGEVALEIENSENKTFQFSDSSRSIVASAARAVLAAVEYFVNAERAFIMLHKALEDARQRKRADLVARYMRELSEVVVSTSYAEVIEQIRKEL